MLSIRPATPQDARLILEFIRDLAEYERAPDAAVATESDLLRDGFGPNPKFQCVIAEWGGQVTAHSAGNLKYVFSQRSRRVEHERCCSDGWPVTC